MLAADTFVQNAAACGFGLWTGVPCSYLTPLINCAASRDDVRYIGAANEGDAVAIASGAELGGRRGVVMIQNSGLGNAVNPLSSLNAIFDIPLLLIVTHRGDPDGLADEPQHALMGRTTGAILDLLEIPWSFLPRDDDAAARTLRQAVSDMDRHGRPIAFVVKRDTFAARELEVRAGDGPLRSTAVPPAAPWSGTRPTRRQIIAAVSQSIDALRDVVVATTGYTGRVLYEASEYPGQLALVGSMGCAAPLGLGLAIAQPDRRVIVLDGDGAILMRMGALATIGHEHPANLVHVCLDNEAHESTGGQATVSHSIDLAQIAGSCGYQVERLHSPDELSAALSRREGHGPRFLHVKTAPGESTKLSRPSIAPRVAAQRLREYLRA